MNKRKICVVTGSRAEYGLLFWLMRRIHDANDLELQLVVTGMHLSPEFGLTYRQIEEDGFTIMKKVEMLISSDTPLAIAKSMGLGMMGFADVYEHLNPDVVLMLGDRFELLAAASAALVARIPIAHIHGGESTEGAFDEAIRHSITKMAHLHFTATNSYRQRVIQLGEHPDRVFNVGAPGLEYIQRIEFLSKEDLQESIGLRLKPQNLLVTWHPVTLGPKETREGLQALLIALDELQETGLIFTKANADTEGRLINQIISDYVAERPDKSVAHSSLGQVRYLSALKYVDGVVGNSSSGIIEAPSLHVGTVDIGTRQHGRIRAPSVIACEATKTSISNALMVLFSAEFQAELKGTINPYGSGNISESIVEVLQSFPLDDIVKKSFYDLPVLVEENDWSL